MTFDANAWAVIIVVLRILVIALLYLFLLRVMSVLVRGLRVSSGAREAVDESAAGWLEVVDSDGAGQLLGMRYPLDPISFIGRDEASTVPLLDSRVSAHHARLVLHGGEWWAEDAGSTNGTFVDEHRITGPEMLYPGSELRVGPVVLRLTEDGVDDVEAAAR